MAPHTSYIICATPRSGSFLLCEALICTQVAGGPGEYFWKGNEPGFRERWGVTEYADYVPAAICQGSTPNGVFGVKIMHGYLDDVLGKMRQLPRLAGRNLAAHEVFAELFPNLHYVWITRRDKVRQAISFARAAQTRIWAWDRDEPPKLDSPPQYRFQEIDSCLRCIVLDEAGWNEVFRAAGVTPHVVVHEHLVDHYEDTARGVLDFLGIQAPEPLLSRPRRMRRQSDELSEEWYRRFVREKWGE